ncbi:MAG: hypothetical protein MZV70_03665 [Desulfobacterales bacterium]|nr:hypothetical protein [Desulfobacterales bacterium]
MAAEILTVTESPKNGTATRCRPAAAARRASFSDPVMERRHDARSPRRPRVRRWPGRWFMTAVIPPQRA